MMVELYVNLIVCRVDNPIWAHQHGLWLVARFHAIQRLVEELPPIVSQALPTLCGSAISPEENQGRPRILTETVRHT
jgi:hypothetical protein